jgi:16S rRNA (adenine1518-N6/adenine1519-N6)-dimethyltransferase
MRRCGSGGCNLAQTQRQIRAMLSAAGIAPLKRFGQHFLVDANLLNKLVAAAHIQSDDVVLEVGPGTGTLTERLLEVSGHVVAVEIDNGLQVICRDRFGSNPRFSLLHRDVLKRKSQIAPEVLDELQRNREHLGGRILLVSNLPYQVATPVLMDLLLGDVPVSPMCCTVQAEVGERLTAPPGSKTYGPLSVIAQALSEVKRVSRVPPAAFWPAPKVESIMLRLDLRPDGLKEPALRSEFIRLVHGCFGQRRKTLRSTLRNLLDHKELQSVESAGRWRLNDRPERLPVGEWIALASFVVNLRT